MASRGRGHRGRPRGASQALPVFHQQAFAEAVGIAAAAIAQASAAGSQGGPSNLHRFRAHLPSTFTGGGDPMVADECLKHSYYTRVGLSFSRLFYSNFIVLWPGS